jgi:hypothetical protein
MLQTGCIMFSDPILVSTSIQIGSTSDDKDLNKIHYHMKDSLQNVSSG